MSDESNAKTCSQCGGETGETGPAGTPMLGGLDENGKLMLGPEIGRAELHRDRPGWVVVFTREPKRFEVEIRPTKTLGVCRIGSIHVEDPSGGIAEVPASRCPMDVRRAAGWMWEYRNPSHVVVTWA